MLPVTAEVKSLATFLNDRIDFGEFQGRDLVKEPMEQVVFEQGLTGLLLLIPDTVKGVPVEALLISILVGMIDEPDEVVPKLAIAMGMSPPIDPTSDEG